ncbi:hypothetical protein LINGRAHAP2_LOCUS18214 [Linum grandiflorum]
MYIHTPKQDSILLIPPSNIITYFLFCKELDLECCKTLLAAETDDEKQRQRQRIFNEVERKKER